MERTASRSVSGTPRSRSIVITLRRGGGPGRVVQALARTPPEAAQRHSQRQSQLQSQSHAGSRGGASSQGAAREAAGLSPLGGELAVDGGAGGQAAQPRPRIQVCGELGHVLRLFGEVHLIQHGGPDVAHNGCARRWVVSGEW